MSKIYVIHENNEWTQHLTLKLEAFNCPFELWHLDKGVINLNEPPPEGIFYNRISASSHTRDHRFAPEFTDSVLAWLTKYERKIINGANALSLEVSKVKQYMALEKLGISTPKTMVAVGKEEIVKAAEQLALPSFITKHNRAGKGLGVRLFHSIKSLKDYVDGSDFEVPIDGITLVQEYIKSPTPHIIRHEFIGGRFLYAVKVDTSEGFELCPADACSIEDSVCPANQENDKFTILEDFNPDYIQLFEMFLKDNNIQVAGIEVIQDKDGRMFTYDVNTNTNYNSDAEKVAGISAMAELAHYLERERKTLL